MTVIPKPMLATGPSRKLGFPSLGKDKSEAFSLALQNQRWREHVSSLLAQKPLTVSTKLDGIRIRATPEGALLARSLKPIANKQLLTHFASIIEKSVQSGIPIDGEVYAHDIPFGDIQGVCNSNDKEVPPTIKFHAFDLIDEKPFIERYARLCDMLYGVENAVVVRQEIVHSIEQIYALYEKRLAEGYEGLILRTMDAPYKFGRSTAKEGYLLKFKPFETFDTKVLEVVERFDNLNQSQTNELGQSYKRNTKDAKQSTGLAASFWTEWEGHRVKVVLTGDEEFRRQVWSDRESLIGRTFEWKGMLVGAKDVPRHPTFIRFREDKNV